MLSPNGAENRTEKKYLHFLVIFGKIKHLLRLKTIKRKFQWIKILSQDNDLPLTDKF